MSRLKQVAKRFYQPTWWLNTAIPHLRSGLNRTVTKVTYSPDGDPTDMMNEEWDNLVILDGCRYDLFEEANTLEGALQHRISPGSATPEFLTETFDEGMFNDTVYVTANPMYRTRGLGNTFHEIIDIWKDEWDEQLQTVTPDTVAEATITAYDKYPNKRIISHFMQPHYPFIGDIAKEIGEHSGYEFAYRKMTGKEAKRDNPTIWELLEEGEVSRELVWEAYRENLEMALPYVETLLNHFQERTVVTSDHGNALGERPFPLGKRMYGHPVGVRHDVLCKVPWLVVEGDSRKEITAEESEERGTEQPSAVKERLSDLGYADI